MRPKRKDSVAMYREHEEECSVHVRLDVTNVLGGVGITRLELVGFGNRLDLVMLSQMDMATGCEWQITHHRGVAVVQLYQLTSICNYRTHECIEDSQRFRAPQTYLSNCCGWLFQGIVTTNLATVDVHALLGYSQTPTHQASKHILSSSPPTLLASSSNGPCVRRLVPRA